MGRHPPAGGALVELPAVTTSVDEEFSNVTAPMVMPNPATTSADVSFELPVSAVTTVTIANTTGNIVQTMDLGNLPAGPQRSSLRVADLASGMYYITIRAGRYTNVTLLMVTR